MEAELLENAIVAITKHQGKLVEVDKALDALNKAVAHSKSEKAKQDIRLEELVPDIASELTRAVKAIPKPLDGLTGKDGQDGTSGPQGYTGETGTQGEVGESGKDGIDGSNGVDGIDGKDGVSVTTIKAFDTSVLFTLSDGVKFKIPMPDLKPFVTSTVSKAVSAIPAPLNGVNGKDGLDGEAGTDGINGEDGTHGLDGEDGKDGLDAVSIKSIHLIGNSMQFLMTDDTLHKVNVPLLKGSTSKTAIPVPAETFQRAINVPYDNSGGTLKAKNVEEALNELSNKAAGGGNPDLTYCTQLEFLFNTAMSSSYKDLNYTAGDITSIDVYEDDSRQLKLFTKLIRYNGGNVSDVRIKDEQHNKELYKEFTYAGEVLTNIETTYA